MMNAMAAMVEKLHLGGPGDTGLIFANGGFASHNHAVVVSRHPLPGAHEPHDYSVQAEAEASRGPEPRFVERYEGPATIETYMMPYGRTGAPAFATIVGLTPAGDRFLAHVPAGAATVLRLLEARDGEPIGRKGMAVALPDGRNGWTI